MSTSSGPAFVTGVGAVTPYGRGVPALWRGLLAGHSAVRPITLFPADDLAPSNAAEVPAGPEDPDRAGALLLEAAAEAVEDAAVPLADTPPARIGVAVGTTLAGMAIFERWVVGEVGGAATPIPYFAPAVRLAAEVRARGPVTTTQLACASGTAAVAVGARWIREGRCDVVLVGGTDLLCRYVVAGFNCLRATADLARPFDEARKGLVLGEGAAMLVLESPAHAGRRGAPACAVVSGAGAAGDATHMTAPDREGRGALRALGTALRRAGVRPADVGFVSAHGTGTVYNDAMEARALAALFGPRGVPVNSVKGAIGHTLGAAGAIEAVLCVQVLRHGTIPPTVGHERLAPDCATLDVVAGAARAADVRACVSTSSGFAGANAALVLERT